MATIGVITNLLSLLKAVWFSVLDGNVFESWLVNIASLGVVFVCAFVEASTISSIMSKIFLGCALEGCNYRKFLTCS